MVLSAMCDIFNYVDDKTACCYGYCTAEVIRGSEKVASDIIISKLLLFTNIILLYYISEKSIMLGLGNLS